MQIYFVFMRFYYRNIKNGQIIYALQYFFAIFAPEILLLTIN